MISRGLLGCFGELSVRGFRRLRDVQLDLRPLSVMIGGNGSGKTSLLDVLTLLASSAQGSLSPSLSEMSGLPNRLTNGVADELEQLATALSISVEITYDRNQDRIIIANHGQTDITLWGDKLDQETPVIEKQPMVVTRGGQYYIIAKAFRKEIMRKIADGSIKQKPVIVPFEVYLKDGKEEEYIARCKFLIAEPGDPFQIHTQTTSIIKKRWSAR